MNTSSNWKSIVDKARANDQAAISELVGLTQKNLFQFCLHMTHNKHLAEDLLHDAYIKGLSSLSQLKNPDSVLAWLKQIARSLHLDYVKSSAYKNEIHSENWFDMDQRQSEDTTGLQMDVLKTLGQMSEDERLILVLIDIQDCSYDEAAVILDVAEGTVKSRLFRAREKFSSLYEGTKKQHRSS